MPFLLKNFRRAGFCCASKFLEIFKGNYNIFYLKLQKFRITKSLPTLIASFCSLKKFVYGKL